MFFPALAIASLVIGVNLVSDGLQGGGGHPVTARTSAQVCRQLTDGPVVDASYVDVTYTVRDAVRLTVRDVSFQIGRQESYGLVGESGSGKTTIALAIVRYLARNGRVSAGSITVAGQDVGALGKDALRKLRAGTVSMVYQEPGRALNPSIRVGRQVAEVFEIAGQQVGSRRTG